MKQRIIMAAAQEMNTRGVKFTVDAVAERLGISKKTLYQFFASKDELIRELVDVAMDDMTSQEETVLTGSLNFPEKLRALLTIEPKVYGKINEWVIDDLQRYRPEDWQRIDQYRRHRIDHVQDFIEQGIAGGNLRPVNAAVAAQMLFGACGELIKYPFLSDNNLTLSDALKALTDIFMFGVLSSSDSRAVKE